MKSRLPDSYIAADWHGTTPVDDYYRGVGISFKTCSGEVIRLRLNVASAAHVAGSIYGFLQDHLTRTHSPNSSGNPSSAVSVPQDGENV